MLLACDCWDQALGCVSGMGWQQALSSLVNNEMLPQAAASAAWRAKEPIQVGVSVPSEGPTPWCFGEEICSDFLGGATNPHIIKSSPSLNKSRSFSCLQNRAEQDQKNTFPQPPKQTHKLMCSANLTSHQQILFSRSCQGVLGSDKAVAVLLIDTAEMEQHVLTASPSLSAI